MFRYFSKNHTGVKIYNSFDEDIIINNVYLDEDSLNFRIGHLIKPRFPYVEERMTWRSFKIDRKKREDIIKILNKSRKYFRYEHEWMFFRKDSRGNR